MKPSFMKKTIVFTAVLLVSTLFLSACHLFSFQQAGIEESLKTVKENLSLPLIEQIELKVVQEDDRGTVKNTEYLLQYEFTQAREGSAENAQVYYEDRNKGEEVAISFVGEGGKVSSLTQEKGSVFKEREVIRKKYSLVDLLAFLEQIQTALVAEEVPTHIEKISYHYDENKENHKEKLNAFLIEPFSSEFLPYLKYTFVLQFDKQNKTFSSFTLKVEDKDTAKHFYTLSWTKMTHMVSPLDLSALQPLTTSSEEKNTVVTLSSEEVEKQQKEETKALLLKELGLANQSFAAMTAYDTTSTIEYKLQADQQSMASTLETNGSEFYDKGAFLHYIGRENRVRTDGNIVNLLAIRPQDSYERSLQSENKSTESSTPTESSTAPTETSVVSKGGWIAIEPKLSAEYYPKLLKILEEYAGEFKTEEKELLLTLSFEGNSPLFFALSKEVLGMDFDYYKQAEIKGFAEIIFDKNVQAVRSLQFEFSSVNNQVIYVKAYRSFQKFRSGDLLPWPVPEN